MPFNVLCHLQASYTLLMLDPDAPSAANPLFADWIHLLYCNIPGKELKKGVNGFGESYDTFFGKRLLVTTWGIASAKSR